MIPPCHFVRNNTKSARSEKGTIKNNSRNKTKNESVQKQNTQKIQKEIQIRRHPTHDGRSRYDKKITTKGYYTTCLIKKKQETENRKKESNFPGFLCLFFSFSSNPKKKSANRMPPHTPPGFYSILLHDR